MKIHKNLPTSGQATRKSVRSSPDGVFKSLLDAKIEPVEPLSDSLNTPSHISSDQAWKALQESISLLDQAMSCLESGDAPTQQMIDEIGHLRSQLAAEQHSSELRQADTILAVEAERIRSMQSS